MFHLEATVHHNRDSTGFSNYGSFGMDHGELAPESSCPDSHSLAGDFRKCVRGAKHIDDIHGDRHVCEALVARFAQDLRFTRVHRNDAVSVSFQIEADKITCAKLGLRQSNNRDGLRSEQHALDGQRVLIPAHIEWWSHRDATPVPADAAATSLAPSSAPPADLDIVTELERITRETDEQVERLRKGYEETIAILKQENATLISERDKAREALEAARKELTKFQPDAGSGTTPGQ